MHRDAPRYTEIHVSCALGAFVITLHVEHQKNVSHKPHDGAKLTKILQKVSQSMPNKPYVYTCSALSSFSICHELEIVAILIFSRHTKKVKIRYPRKFQASISLIFFVFVDIPYVCKDLVVH
jgi:hypothetical protein